MKGQKVGKKGDMRELEERDQCIASVFSILYSLNFKVAIQKQKSHVALLP